MVWEIGHLAIEVTMTIYAHVSLDEKHKALTGNVSNVFLTQQEWLATLGGVPAALRPGGYLVFESVDPAGRPWRGWNRDTTYVRRESPDAGVFESWLEVTWVHGDLVSTRRTFVFAADGATLISEGIRRYPPRPVIEDSLVSAAWPRSP